MPTETSGLSASLAYRFFVQLRIVVASVALAMSFARQGGSILQAVTQYVTKLTASIHAKLYRLLMNITKCYQLQQIYYLC